MEKIIKKKVHICDKCKEEITNPDEWNKCFSCGKDMCEECRAYVSIRYTSRGGNYIKKAAYICIGHLPEGIDAYASQGVSEINV